MPEAIRSSYLALHIPNSMRFSLVVCLLLVTAKMFAQANIAVTLDDVQIKRFDSKKKYPATVLRYEPDAFTDLVAVKVLKGKVSFSGSITDEKSGVVTHAVVSDGIITGFTSDDRDNARRQLYRVTSNANYAWYATDSVYYDNQLFSTSVFFRNTEGEVMMTNRIYSHDHWMTERSYRIGVTEDGKTVYNEPLEDGISAVYHNGICRSSETYRDGLLNGEMLFCDEHKTVLQKYYVSAQIGLYGPYYEYDTVSRIVTTGQYNYKGVETGQWISKYSDSSVAHILWIGPNGNPDSSKSWDRRGNLSGVEYNYWKPSKNPAVKDYVHYSRSWFANGKGNTYINYNPQPGDTIYAEFDVTGIPVKIERSLQNRVQRKTWYPNGALHSERYGIASGVAGVTVRDSVYREWNADGTLSKERYYDKGRFVRSADPIPAAPRERATYQGPACVLASVTPASKMPWDTALMVPQPILDSLTDAYERVSVYCRETNHEASRALFEVYMEQQITSLVSSSSYYTLKLAQMEYVRLDTINPRLVTNNIQLNQFLDSIGLIGGGIVPTGNFHRRKGKVYSDFRVNHVDAWGYLNLHYVNRRLDAIAPGSRLAYSLPTADPLPAEIIYIPQGEMTGFGVIPFAVLAVADDGAPQEVTTGNRTVLIDNRTFYLFHIYGDGEVEFARTTYKDRILQQYRGQKNDALSR